jgi:hypothetical protein
MYNGCKTDSSDWVSHFLVGRKSKDTGYAMIEAVPDEALLSINDDEK